MSKPPVKKTDAAGADSRALSDAEGDLWQQVMGDVEPLEETGATKTLPPAALKKTAAKPGSPAASKPVSKPASKPAPPPPPELRHGEAPGLDRSTQMKMRRGKVAIEARMDLHGMTQAEAHRALNAFLQAAQDAGRRTALVITGKGRGKDGDGEGILRAAVPRWLNEGANRGMVRAFSHAAPKDGGEGALYIMLKKLK
ncbi:MAG: Smr/MutS family protein [Rhodospirillales bacterium]|nr:Smr/MutS family protein [Alphaproteobacteria bacterium]MBL6948862.1 Smr/MutS family protein [Rhodospirillales bacterium]